MKKIIYTENAPAPIGPYSQAVQFGNTLYTSGQIAINPSSGELVMGTIEDETEQVMQNLAAILEAAGFGFEHVVKCGIFLSNMDDFARVNEVYGRYFQQHPPARETVQVARLPKSVNVEISCIAIQ
jgi:2-iminobutanoate/2-iminopropanoate deaminase